tara:strand:+ start:995 stop:1858 length:864 start_codon:yes stop_codon:yes gene_type:complete
LNFQPFKKILIGFAFSPNLKANIYEALWISSALNAEIIFFHVGEKTSEKVSTIENIIRSCPQKNKNFSICWKNGSPVPILIKACYDLKIDLLLIGALKRENVFKFYLGSIARKITRTVSCSVLLLINPSTENRLREHVVVNALDSPKAKEIIKIAFSISKAFSSSKLTLVEEISSSKVAVQVDDDVTLKKAMLKKERLTKEEKNRVEDVVKNLPKEIQGDISWKTQSIFGKRGYSIGHYAKVVRADLLIMNSKEKYSFINRLFAKDLEHILAEIPTDVLIVKNKKNG